jgi:hypothetical protein
MTRLHTLAAAAALLLAGTAVQAENRMTMTTTAADLLPGATFEVLVRGAEFAASVLGGGFALRWDPSVLALDSVAIDAATWEFARNGGLVDNASGTLSDAYFASNRAVLPTGEFAIARLGFTAVGAGTTTVVGSESPLFPWVSEVGEVLAVDYGQLRVTVGVVPEPATWAMFAGALALLPLVRRRLTA